MSLAATLAAVALPALLATGPTPEMVAAATLLPEEWQPVAREILAELVSIDSTHERGSTEAATALQRRFLAAGFAPADAVLAGPAPHKQNLVVRLKGCGKEPPVLYVLHLDVVAARREDWTRDPFVLGEEDGFFYGRGTSDMKNDVAAMAVTLLRARADAYIPDRDVIVAFTDDEEAGSPATNGVRWLLDERPELVKAALAINPDAGGGDLVKGRRVLLSFQTSEKVYQSFRLVVTDRGGHSSIPHAGNPIFRLAAALERLSRLQFPVRLSETTRGYFATLAPSERGPIARDLAALGRTPTPAAAAARVAARSEYWAALMHTTCVPTELSGGHAENALPQAARATINCRVLPEHPIAEVEATLRQVIADPGVALERVDAAQPSPASPIAEEAMGPLRRVAAELFPGVTVAPALSTGASDSLWLRRRGVPTYGVSGMFGDVDDVRAHGRDERIGAVDFYDGVEFSHRYLRELAGGSARSDRSAMCKCH